MTLGPTLETARLILRPPIQDDFDGFAEMCADEETMRFIGGLAPRNAAWRQMATCTGSWSLLGYGFFSVIEQQSGQWLGRLGPWRPGGESGGWPVAEIGWGLKRSAQGKGYAAEAAAAAIDWSFDHLGWPEIMHCIDPMNAPSIALAERLGSKLVRKAVPMPAPFDAYNVDIYGQSQADWRARPR